MSEVTNPENEEQPEEKPYENVYRLVDRKVYGLQKYEPPDTTRDHIKENKIDQFSLNMLNHIKKGVKEGKLRGLVVLAGEFDEGGNLVDCATYVSETGIAYPLSYIGATYHLQQYLSDSYTRKLAKEGDLDDYSNEENEEDEDDE